MPDLKLGVTYGGLGGDAADFAALVEELGYDSVWTGEHIANWHPITTVMPVLGAMAARTKRVSVGSAILLLPLRQPVLIAKELSILDRVSHGRLIVGIGVGGENPAEFTACGVPVKERGPRTNELLQILSKLWRGDGITWHGRFYTLDGVTLDPKPQQAGGPKVIVAGRREGAMKRAALYADGVMPYLFSPEQYAKALQEVRDFAGQANRELDGFEYALYQFIAVAQTKDEARRMAIAALSRAYQQDFTNLVDKFVVYGTPFDCVARLREYIAAGAKHICFALAAQDYQASEQVRLIARDVTPGLRGAR